MKTDENISMQELQALKKALVWQCRRGIKEIEILLIPFLENDFVNEDQQTRDRFVRLLDQQDLDIFEWFNGRSKPDDEDMESIVNVILSRVASRHHS
jgi:antitoxin CptB